MGASQAELRADLREREMVMCSEIRERCHAKLALVPKKRWNRAFFADAMYINTITHPPPVSSHSVCVSSERNSGHGSPDGVPL